MERDRQLEAQKPQRRSLIDPYLVGPPSRMKRMGLTPKEVEGSPSKEAESASKDEAVKSEEEEEETHSEATPTKTTPTDDEPWAETDSEDEDLEVCACTLCNI